MPPWHLELYGYLKYSSLNYLFEFRVIMRIIVLWISYVKHHYLWTRKSYVNLLFLWENCHQNHDFSASTSPVVAQYFLFILYALFSRLKLKKCLFQDILGSRTLSDRVLVLLSNMETYLRFASREPTSAWESQLSHFEAFFRKLPSVLPENVSLSRKIYS